MLSFNKYFYEETQTPNIKIVEDEKGNILHYNDQGNLIYNKDKFGNETFLKFNDQGQLIYVKYPSGSEHKFNDQGKLIYIKDANGEEKKFNDQGKLIYQKNSDGTESKYNDQGQLIYIKYPDGKEEKYNDKGKLIYIKYPDGTEHFTEYKYNDQGNLIYIKYLDGTESKYNDQGKLIYQKNSDGTESKYNDQGQLIYIKYPDGTEYKYNDQGKVIYQKDPDGKETFIKHDEYGLLTKERQIAIKKAENYMRDYHGMFLHAFDPNSLDNTLNIPENHEVCVSTVRSSTIFRSENRAIVFIGFGNIRELYDFDAYSNKISKGEKKGARYATANIKQSPALHDIKFDNLKTYHKEFNRSNYYDEGFMALADADVIIASLPNEYSEEFPEFTKQIKSVYPNIKIINSKQFERIKDSDSLLTLLYRLKQERDDKELMDKPFNKYEEKFILFKDFFLL